MSDLFAKGASKVASVGGDAVGFMGKTSSKVVGAVSSTSSIVAGKVGGAVT